MKRIVIFAILALVAGTAVMDAKGKKAAKAAPASLEALFDRADEALVMYNTDNLETAIGEIEERLNRVKNPNAEDTERLRSLQNRLIALRNMLSRVEQLVIVDSVTVPRNEVLGSMPLSGDAGTLSGEGELTSFIPAGGREVFFTERDSAGNLRIMRADILDDGTREAAEPLRLFEDETVQTAYPFMLSDGSTLYFAADADTDNTLGEWDIFRTRRDETGKFYEPTNLGMPYNSPGDDFLLVIDDSAGIGYWATDRNAPDDEVTLFTFQPSDTRINYDADRSDLSDLAYIINVAATQPEGFDAQAVLDKAARAREAHSAGGNASAGQSDFSFSLGDGRVYTSPSQFKSPAARTLLRQYISQKKEVENTERQLADMRVRFGNGETGLRSRILQAEKQLDVQRRRLQNAANALVRAERRR